MGPGWMHGTGYSYNGPAATTSTTLLPRDEVQKGVDAFVAESFPGYKVGKVERYDNGRPFYGALLTGKNSRFEIQVNGIDGRVIGIYPIAE